MLAHQILFFILGLSVGSFLNSVTLRYNTGEKVTKGRSRCFNCSKTLSALELLPLVSYIFLKGKCRSCRSVISWQYPAAELLTGILFLSIFVKWMNNYPDYGLGVLFFWLLFVSILIAIAIYDLRHKIIPDSFSYALLAVAVLGNLFFFKINLAELLLSLIPSLFLFLLWLFSRGRWMGLGDSKLMLGGGIFLGFPASLSALILSFWVGGALGIVLLLASSKITLKSEIPFGPFLASGILLAFFFGDFLMPFAFFYG